MNAIRICRDCGSPVASDQTEGLCARCLMEVGLDTRAPREAPADSTSPSAGSDPQAIPLPDPGLLARYFPQLEILELLGQGGMGAVYKARQRGLDRLVAVKLLPRKPATDAGFSERFGREARALARLNHPNIVAVHEFGQVEGNHYLIMEYVDGPNLRQIEQTTRLEPGQALQIVPQICEALQFAHEEGIVHRDIKPENVLIDSKGRVKIADFGLAKILGQETRNHRLTGAKDIMGTPHYMAPEQIERPREVDHRADIYSLGVVFYEMLTGELPLGKFQAPSKKARLDLRLDDVVLRALEKEPDRRYQHASEIKTDVQTITSTPDGAGAPLLAGNLIRPRRISKVAYIGCVGVAALSVLGVWLAVTARPHVPARRAEPSRLKSMADIPRTSPMPPVVVRTVPESGASGVDAGLTELEVTFSARMKEGTWSLTKYGDESLPEPNGQPRYLADGRTCVCPVKLKPGKVYAVWINSETAHDFQDVKGQSALPYLLIFETK